MITLKLFLENNGRSWTLRPNREYIIGSDTNCQIPLLDDNLASQQLKFSFNTNSNLWYVYNLDGSDSVYINNQPLTEYPIINQVRISINNSLAFVAIPEGSQDTFSPEPGIVKASTFKQEIPLVASTLDSEQINPRTVVRNKLEDFAVVKYINRFFLDQEDPEQLRGVWLKDFSFSFSQSLALKDDSSRQRIPFKDQSQLQTVRGDLYKGIYESLQEYQKSDPHLNQQLRFRIIDYKDYQYEADRDRIYIEMVWNTIRNTQITTLLRFFVNGDNLYIANDFYALGRLGKRKLIFQSIILLFLVIFIVSTLGQVINTLSTAGTQVNVTVTTLIASSSMIYPTIAIWYLYSTWIKFIRVLFQREPFFYALRVNFPKNIKSNTFDLDDTYMFIKSIYPLVISSLEETLRKHGLFNKDLTELLEDIRKNIGQTTITVNTGGGNIIGAIIGGISNAVNNQSQGKE